MAAQSISPARVVEDARRLLRTVRVELERGRRPYTSDVRRLVERSLALRFAEYVQFLEKFGFLTLERRTDTLNLTAAGGQVVDGHEGRLRGMAGDVKYHFGDRLNDAPLAAEPGVEAQRLDGRYLRYERIGRGGLGTVSRGHHLALDRPVALKLFEGLGELFRPDQQEEVRRRMELAVRAHARLISPFVVQILDQNADHDPPYFVMELAEGGNLRGLLEDGPLAPAVALRYFVQVALGLKVAHAQGLLHRDLKPEAVLLDAVGNVKLSDFGLTRIAERDGARVRQAYVGFGSVGYMAPELFRGGAPGPAADIYALGILLYEMLTGELPGRRSPMPSDIAEGVPTDLDELFDRMTQDDPAQRPTDLDAVLTAVWTSKEAVALLDARQAPYFVEPPVTLPGLPGPRRDPLESLLADEGELEPAEEPAPEIPAVQAAAPAAQAPVAQAPAPQAAAPAPQAAAPPRRARPPAAPAAPIEVAEAPSARRPGDAAARRPGGPRQRAPAAEEAAARPASTPPGPRPGLRASGPRTWSSPRPVAPRPGRRP
ncbi:MAG: serine/threonine protein kinase [Myxococcales bacterium]|nr:serine/threonine protein kinase [Myxococcales bacterium]